MYIEKNIFFTILKTSTYFLVSIKNMHCSLATCGKKDCHLWAQWGINMCAIRKSLHILWGKRAIPVLVCVVQPRRYGKIKKDIADISEKMLIQTLRQLEEHAFITRKDYQTIPPKVEYSITSFWKEALKILPILIKVGKQL